MIVLALRGTVCVLIIPFERHDRKDFVLTLILKLTIKGCYSRRERGEDAMLRRGSCVEALGLKYHSKKRSKGD